MNRRERLIARARQGFRMAFNVEPTRFYAAPGRVNLIGDYVDFNHGLALTCAIDRDLIVALGTVSSGKDGRFVEAVAVDMGSARDVIMLDRAIEPSENNWQNHVRGVVHALRKRGYELKPVQIAIAGDIPIGAGLASSAAMGVAVAKALSHYSNLNLSDSLLAIIAHEAETGFVGVDQGVVDQMAASASQEGNALLLDCQSMEHMPIPFFEDLALVAIDSGVRRQVAKGGFSERRAQCEAAAKHYGVPSLRELSRDFLNTARGDLDEVCFLRARHVVTEIERVEPLAVALVKGDTSALRNLMRESHVSLRDDFEVSVTAIDHLVETVAAALGDNGGVRLTGAGVGGCVLAVLARDAVESVVEAVENRYNRSADIPAQALVLTPSAGASKVS